MFDARSEGGVPGRAGSGDGARRGERRAVRWQFQLGRLCTGGVSSGSRVLWRAAEACPSGAGRFACSGVCVLVAVRGSGAVAHLVWS